LWRMHSEMADKDGIQTQGGPYRSPIDPVELDLESVFQFRCHKDIACFNACCKNIDITLTPYDVLRLKRRLGLSSSEFVATYTVPFAMDHHDMPGLKMATKPKTTQCVFLNEDGCGIYEDRPIACRYYALGSMGVRKKAASDVEDIFFVVREEHCLGHQEPDRQTVAQYRQQQGCEGYDQANRTWREIILKKRSGGPAIGAPSERSLQLFDMCSYDMDSFREFIQTEGFEEVFDISDNDKKTMIEDEDKLLQFALRFMKQVLYGERSIPVRQGAKQSRLRRHRAGS